jgi:peptidoglycan/xylan/chitin deacetylase (PgdA/CDA1 family)
VNEIHRIYNTGISAEYIPTAAFVSEVKQENQSSGKTAYLTFDDGPSRNSEKILNILKKKQVKATFFLIGSEITKEREKIVKKEIKQGNAVGVHTFCHDQNEIYRDRESFFADYNKASERIRELTGTAPKLHRFPWGSNNGYVSSYVDELHEKLASMGVRSFDWNVSGEDSVGGTVTSETIFQNVKKDLSRFQEPIILLHDSAAMDNTAAVLERIIDYIRSEGYGFDTLENREEYLFPASWR